MQRVIVLIAVLVVGCGGGGNPASPSPGFPTVAGSYSGTTTMTFPELNQTITCPTTTSVTQNDGSINVAPLVLGGQCGNVSLPVGNGTIDSTGALQGSATGTVSDTCGVYNYTGSGGFFGRELRISIVYTSTTCYNMNLTIVVAR